MSAIAPKTPALEARPNIMAWSTYTFPFQNMHSACCWSGLIGVSQYTAEMLKVAANKLEVGAKVLLKVPHLHWHWYLHLLRVIEGCCEGMTYLVSSAIWGSAVLVQAWEGTFKRGLWPSPTPQARRLASIDWQLVLLICTSQWRKDRGWKMEWFSK